MIRFGLRVLLLLLPTAALAQPVTFAPDPSGHTEFIMPSGNVGCIYIPAGGTKVYQAPDGGPELSCDRVAPKYVHVTMAKAGAAKQIVNPGEQGCCHSTNTLAYGQSWAAGPFTCESKQSGLTCKRSDGHGFAISRQSIRVH